VARQRYVAAIDQGTTSTRCVIVDEAGAIYSLAQLEHAQIFPAPGLVEHDAVEIWNHVRQALHEALVTASLTPRDLAAIGITNQRETTLVWDRATGKPVHNAIVWQDARTDTLVRQLGGDVGPDRYRERTGLPLTTYFSGPKLLWLLEKVPGLRTRAKSGDVVFGTMDSWLIWNLTGGAKGGRHVTDVTNASRTMLMNLQTLQWDREILAEMGIPEAMLPQILSSAEIYGEAGGFLAGVPVASALGDQHAALFGEQCFAAGDVKSTYGTGSFLLMNTGTKPIRSTNGLITTVGYQIKDQPAAYALEGSIAVTGALVQWFRDRLGLIDSAGDIEPLAASVADNGGCYFVPAFSGLFAPHWRSDARGVIAGLTAYVTKAHIARAILEATAWQTREVLDAMTADTGMEISELKVDGGMTTNNLLMQMLADALAVTVVRPKVTEATCLGAAYAAGLSVGYWPHLETIAGHLRPAGTWTPAIDPERRDREYALWKKAVQRTLNWIDTDS
jgi:glycerol kinase